MQLLFPPGASKAQNHICFKCASHLEMLGQIFCNLKAQSDTTGQYLRCCFENWQPESLAEGVSIHSKRFSIGSPFSWIAWR